MNLKSNKYLDFDKQEKGFEPFAVTRENIKTNIGKKICYVDYIEPYRGTYFVRYGTIHSVKYSRLFLDDGYKEVDIRNILKCGIEIPTNNE